MNLASCDPALIKDVLRYTWSMVLLCASLATVFSFLGCWLALAVRARFRDKINAAIDKIARDGKLERRPS